MKTPWRVEFEMLLPDGVSNAEVVAWLEFVLGLTGTISRYKNRLFGRCLRVEENTVQAERIGRAEG